MGGVLQKDIEMRSLYKSRAGIASILHWPEWHTGRSAKRAAFTIHDSKECCVDRYHCHKKVWAEKIVDIEMDQDGSGRACLQPGSIKVDKRYMEMHNPRIGGYYVRYEDGYESFSPPGVFEDGYSRIPNTTLARIVNPLFTSKYTQVFGGNISDRNASAFHDFEVCAVPSDGPEIKEPQVLVGIHFQQGPIKECGINGVANEDLLLMVITRLQAFQQGPFACRDNAVAITKLEEAVMWLRKRTLEREQRNVEGTYIV